MPLNQEISCFEEAEEAGGRRQGAGGRRQGEINYYPRDLQKINYPYFVVRAALSRTLLALQIYWVFKKLDVPNAQCPLALSEAVRVASRREGMPNAQCP